MLDSEIRIILGYLRNLLDIHGHNPGVFIEIGEHLESNRVLLGEQYQAFMELAEKGDLERLTKTQTRTRLRKLRKEVGAILEARVPELSGSPASSFENNLGLISDHLGLESIERQFLGLVARHQRYGAFSSFLNEVTRNRLNTMEACAACLGVDVDLLNEYLRPGTRLLLSGVLQRPSRSGTDLDDHYQIVDAVSTALQRNTGGLDDLLSAILGEPVSGELSWDDFAHLAPMRDRLFDFLVKAMDERLPGINILIWGAPGTGKTEFCKALARQLGRSLYAIGEVDDEGREPNRRERMGCYQMFQNLLRYRSDALLLFDEMDDVFDGSALARLLGGKPSVGSKVFLNRLLEKNPIPTFWLINDVDILDEAFVRRMALAVEMKVPPPSAREAIWQRVLRKHEVELPAGEMRRLAELNIAPAVIDSAARFTRRVGGGVDDFRFAARGIVQAMCGGRPLPPETPAGEFCPELTCADLDLDFLTRRLCAAPGRRFSLCLYGPPGTGKSAYLRHLAEQMNMPVLIKRASDLLNKYVGGSEARIAGAFREAIDNEAFLIFDEADSLLGDRRQAHHSWEVSQVNEMLTWMESHPLPFACTTNLRERLDQASLRRFTFKCCFDYLHAGQVQRAFEHFFGMQVPAADAAMLCGLTPGDFAVVRNKAGVFGMLANAEGLCRLLREEVVARELSAPARVVGFRGRE